MEPILKEENKRKVAALIPYRSTSAGFEFYLQKRDMNARVHAGIFSMFGGGIEDKEDRETAMKREIQEELEYEPQNAQYFCRLETWRAIFYIFIEKVDSDFESLVVVHEGEYGKFLSFDSIDRSKDVSDIAEMATRGLVEYLSNPK